MNRSLVKAIFSMICACGLAVNSQAQNVSEEKAPRPVEIAGTQSLQISSKIVGQDFDLYVNLPRNYNDKSRTFPVLYLIDGQWDFPMVVSQFGEQYYDGFIPEIIIVGIKWGGENPDYDYLRARDLSPTKVSQYPQSGNAPKFLQFIKQEVIPLIESKYRTTQNERTLVGSSFGGLFTLYTLFTETNLFNRYILTSPAIQWDNGVIYKIENEYAEKNSKLPIRLYMGIGEYENVDGLNKFIEKLKSRNYTGLSLQTQVYAGTGHSATKAEGYSRGLQFAYAKQKIKLDELILKQYVGKYEFAPGMNAQISSEDGNLVAVTPDNQKILLYPETEKDFFAVGFYLKGHFQKDDSGKVSGITLEQFGGSNFIKKVE